MSLIATGDPCDKGKHEGVAEEQISVDTNTEMKRVGRDGKYHICCITE